MAQNKGDTQKGTSNSRLDKTAEELEREARHQAEGTERRDVTDAEAGEDRIKEKGQGGYGADESSVSQRREAPPLSDKR